MLHKTPLRTRVLSVLLVVLYLFVVGGSLIPILSDVHATAQDTLSFYAPFLTPFRYTTKNTSGTLTEEEIAELSALVSHIPQPAYDAFLMDNPLSFLWINLSASPTSIKYSVNRTGTEIVYTLLGLNHTVVPLTAYTDPAGMTQQLKERVVGFTPTGNTMYEKVKSIHDYVCRLATYSFDGSFVHSAYGALIERKAVCEGYAEAFKILCDANGIDCLLVSGVADNGSATENHLWNYVRMDDGKWYAVDATWNDGTVIEDRYFLIGSDTVVVPETANRAEIKFSDNHMPDGDINNTGKKVFSYPNLSHDSYLVNNPSGQASAYYEYGEASRYFYNQLDIEQQNFYYYLTQLTPPVGPGPTPTPAATDDLIETEPDTESITSEPVITEPTDTETTDSETTDTHPVDTETTDTEPTDTETTDTEPVDTETTDTETTDTETTDTETTDTEPVDTEPVDTEPVDTETTDTETTGTETTDTQPVDTETTDTEPIVTEPLDTETTVTEPIVTEPMDTETTDTKPIVTEPVTTEITAPVTDPITTSPTTTEPITNPPATTVTRDTEPSTTSPESEPVITLPPLSTTTPTPIPPQNSTKDTVVYVLRVIVIVLALLALFLVVILTFIKISRKENSSM